MRQKNNPQWYKQCYDESMSCFTELSGKEKGFNRDDRIHGALIVLNEILRFSNCSWERKYMYLEGLNVEHRKYADDNVGIMTKIKVPFIGSLGSPTSASATAANYIDFSKDAKFLRQNNLVQESAVCRSLVTENYAKLCKKVMEQKYSKSSYVTQIFLLILPRLAALQKDVFVKQYLKGSIQYLLDTLIVRGKEREKNMAFITLGYLAVAVEKEIEEYVQSIMQVIAATLPSKDTPSKKRNLVDPSVFMCVTLLGHALKSAITQDVKELLAPMMASGLSPALTICLRELCENVPHVKHEIIDGLLKILSQVLINKPLNPIIITKGGTVSAPLSGITIIDPQIQGVDR